MKKKIGVYVCQCGSNISDYVDVEAVREAASKIEGVEVARTTMFACADSEQNAMIDDIKENELDSLVVASCSPKLHLFTFRGVAERAGLNPYNYVQANIREQASWAHSNDPKGATVKAIQVVKSAIAKVKYAEDLVKPKISANNAVLVIGAGVAGMRAAIELADMGTAVSIIEKEHFVGGRASQWSKLFSTNQTGQEVVERMYHAIDKHENITLYTGAELIENDGNMGDFKSRIRIKPRFIDPQCKVDDPKTFEEKLNKAIEVCPEAVDDEFNFGITKRKAIYKNYHSEFPECPAIDMDACTKCGECVKVCDGIDLEQQEKEITLNPGAILLTTGFDPYEPAAGEYGYGESDYVLTLQQYQRLIELNPQQLIYKGRKIKDVAYIYCVGSRQQEGDNKYCSRYCCTSAINTAIHTKEKYRDVRNYHFNRGIRTYGKQEDLYTVSSKQRDIYLQFDADTQPSIKPLKNELMVSVQDILTQNKEIEVAADLVVLVTGMTPRKNNKIGELLKVPIGRDRFFNEVHPKLKPVETVIDGVYIAGSSQAPLNITESVKSSLSAASKANGLLRFGEIELEPTLAQINNSLCVWCGKCLEACPFDAFEKVAYNDKEIAAVITSKCKGCGMCLPVCPENAIDLVGYSDPEMETIIAELAD
ncbi:MAG: 4Fe-4S binding protein [Bacteroidota bacterium]